MKTSYRMALVAAALALAGAGGATYWVQSGKSRSTDNAYVNADIVQVGSQLSGPVVKVYVHEGQLVHAGDALFAIDPAPYAAAVALATARLGESAQGLRQDRNDVSADAAGVARAQADLDNAQSNASRVQKLVQDHFLSTQAQDDARVKVQVAQATLAQARAKLAGAQAHVAEGPGGIAPSVQAARAVLAQAQLNLEHTQVRASKDGWITNLSLVEGSTVLAGQPLFALVVKGSFWVDANFKETELPGITPGQKAHLELDMLPGKTLEGVVESIGNGTGAAFSLLPAQNATGNWVKVTQRVPVRVRLLQQDALPQLRVGASTVVSVQLQP